MNTAETVTEKIIKKNLSITFMESCTSGLLASMFTDTSGASAVFKGSLVTYSNEMKVAAGVPAQIIEEHGVYSAECARAMAETVKRIYGADIAIGITGTTGNVDPANKDSVLGEAFCCIMFGNEFHDLHIKEDVSRLSRKEIKQRYADRVYERLRDLLL
ncbi:CinA family protein [Treponema sp.]|uniref:CinA family protein n=1 Tax=Treponema sp. TaxID=166 RepID=UPI00388FA980